MDWGAAVWIVPYFIGMLVISYFGDVRPRRHHRGVGIFKHVLDQGGNDDFGLYGGLLVSALGAW